MLCFRINGVPPTVNHAYFNLPRGGRTLSKEGKKYKVETAAYLVRTYPAELQQLKKNVAYGVAIKLYFEKILNDTWPEKAESRYKRIDASNRIKLLEDAFITAAGTDDSQHLLVAVTKAQVEWGGENTILCIWDIEKEGLLPNDLGEYLR
jgi:hypothetical protein